MLDVAERGEGIAIGWARSTKPRLDAGTLVRLSGFSLPMPDHIGAYIPRSSRTNPLVREFVDLLRSKVEPLDLL